MSHYHELLNKALQGDSAAINELASMTVAATPEVEQLAETNEEVAPKAAVVKPIKKTKKEEVAPEALQEPTDTTPAE